MRQIHIPCRYDGHTLLQVAGLPIHQRVLRHAFQAGVNIVTHGQAVLQCK